MAPGAGVWGGASRIPSGQSLVARAERDVDFPVASDPRMEGGGVGCSAALSSSPDTGGIRCLDFRFDRPLDDRICLGEFDPVESRIRVGERDRGRGFAGPRFFIQGNALLLLLSSRFGEGPGPHAWVLSHFRSCWSRRPILHGTAGGRASGVGNAPPTGLASVGYYLEHIAFPFFPRCCWAPSGA